MTQTAPLIDLSNATVRYPRADRPAVGGITLSLRQGERLLITGPSGSGKSTLLYAMAGIIPALVPAEVEGVTRSSSAVGIVLQNPEAQMIAPNVEEEVAFALENRGMAAEAMNVKIQEVLEQLGILRFRGRNPSTLSGGEAQKVALAAALAQMPDVLLLDEPTAFLDPTSTHSFFQLVRNLDPKIAIVIVEHKLEYVEDVIDRYLMLSEGGSLAEEGVPSLLAKHFWFGAGTARSSGPTGARISGLEHEKGTANPSVSFGGQVDHARQPVLEVRGLCHRYAEDTVALADVSFDVMQGETVVVMGPNGSGKSTLLDRVAAVRCEGGSNRHRRFRASRGAANSPIRFFGNDVTRMRARDLYSRLLSVPQNPEHMFLKETVDDEVTVQDSSADLAEGVLARFRLTNYGQRNPYSLSEGEKRRLNLACAFVDPRDLLLLDEPTYGLDAQAILSLVDALAQFKAERRTVLLVTHSPELAFLVADRLLVLDNGRVAFSGTPEELQGAGLADGELYIPAWLKDGSSLPAFGRRQG